jgi:hypothetical protein
MQTNKLLRPLLSGLAFLLGTLLTGAASAQTAPPALFFSDLVSGPNSGGETVSSFAGAYVTLYGNNLGGAQGTSSVTLNGSNCLRVVSWGTTHLWYQKIVVQVGPSCVSGNFQVTTSAGASNVLPFTVRAGNIYCVTTNGNDNNPGTFSGGCFATVTKAVHGKMTPGDTTYVGNGVSQTTQDNYNATLAIMSSGSASAPMALVAYPGAIATVGNVNIGWGIRTPAISGGPFSDWVFAGLTLRGHDGIEMEYNDNTRVVGNDIACPNGTGADACVHTSQLTNYKFLGNYVHDSGTNCGSDCKLYHAVYFSTDSNHIETAWNLIVPDPSQTGVAGCRAMQFNSSPLGGGSGLDQYDLHAHDNVIHNAVCDGINLNTVNPDAGVVEAYNNVIYHVGTGPDPNGSAANYTCINAGSAATHTNAILLYNNSLFDCGGRGASEGDAGALSLYIPSKLTNNIFQETSNETYLSNTTSGMFCSIVASGSSNNIWFGLGNGPTCSNLTGNINADPQFVAPSSGNLSVQSGSPAVDAGASVSSLAFDILGISRPQGLRIDIGAYEFFSGGSTAQKPNPPTGLTVIVQ